MLQSVKRERELRGLRRRLEECDLGIWLRHVEPKELVKGKPIEVQDIEDTKE